MRGQIAAFLARPFGAMELEMFIAATELVYGSEYLLWTWSFWRALGALFLVSCSLTSVGIWLFFRRDPICAPLRWAGALFSIVLWSMMTILVHPAFLLSALAETRIMISAWRRPWPEHGK